MDKIRIAVDVMSGDNAPEVLIKGVLDFAFENSNILIILVGRINLLEKELKKREKKFSIKFKNIELYNADDIIFMNESPAKACKLKPNSSVMVAAKLVADGKADAYVSPGNSGATMVASLFYLKRIQGVKRPAIVATLPSLIGYTVLLDVGANVSVIPEHLLQFAIMGSIYASKILKINNPKIGLLTIGEEAEKGNELISKSYELLKSSNLNFIGNIEGKNLNDGKCDVAICDGFIGNISLKVAEGVANVIVKFFKKVINKNIFRKIIAFLLLPAFAELQRKIDSKEYGGALLLGTNGITIISHGNSNDVAIKNAIKFALFCVQNNFNSLIEKSFKEK